MKVELLLMGYVIILEFIAFVFLLKSKKILEPSIKIIIFSAGLTFFIEFFSFVNQLAYNDEFNTLEKFLYSAGFNIVAFLAFFYYYYTILTSKLLKKIQLFIICLFIISTVINIIRNDQFFTAFPAMQYCVSVLLILFSISLFLFQTFNSDSILKLSTYLPFYISLSLIINYVSILPLIVLMDGQSGVISMKIFRILMFGINTVGYGIFFLGIYKVRNEYYRSKKLSS